MIKNKKEAVQCLEKNGWAVLSALAHSAGGQHETTAALRAIAYLVGGDWPGCIESNARSNQRKEAES